MGDFAPELGQAVFSNGVTYTQTTPGYITSGFDLIAAAIQQARGIDPTREYPLTSNGGAEPWEGAAFAMRSYCWCDGDRDGHEDGCPPNFEHYPSGFAAAWYKHAERGESCTTPPPPALWAQIIAECVAEVVRDADH